MIKRGEMAGAGAVQGRHIPPDVQADQVDRDGGVDTPEGDFGQAVVAGVADTAGGGGLVDGRFGAGADGVPVLQVSA